jgi:hypothetical protein
MDFAELFSRAWQISWKHKILWIFGIFAGCGQQGSSSFNFGFDSSSFQSTGQASDFSDIPPEAIALFVSILAIGIVFAVIAYLLGVVGRLGIIQGVVGAEAGEEKLSFGELFRRSQPYFGRALLLNFIVLLAGVAIAITIGIAFVSIAFLTLGLGLLCLIPLICFVVAPLGAFISIIVEQANVALVLEDLPVMEAFKRAWNVVRDNVGSYIVLGLLLFIGGIILSVILTLPVLGILVPIIAAVADGSRDALLGFGFVTLLCFVIYLPILLALSGLVQTFVKSTWTLTFMRLTSGAEAASD